MWFVKIHNKNQLRSYTEKWRGYTSREGFAELAKYQKELVVKYTKGPVAKCIVMREDGYAWRYFRNGQYVYHHIKGEVPARVLTKYMLQNAYAQKAYFEVR